MCGLEGERAGLDHGALLQCLSQQYGVRHQGMQSYNCFQHTGKTYVSLSVEEVCSTTFQFQMSPGRDSSNLFSRAFYRALIYLLHTKVGYPASTTVFTKGEDKQD